MLINEYLSKKTKISDQSTIINFEKGNKGYSKIALFRMTPFPLSIGICFSAN